MFFREIIAVVRENRKGDTNELNGENAQQLNLLEPEFYI